MQKLIASVDFDKNIIYADWEALFDTKVTQISEEHKTQIHYEVRINEIDSKIEIRLRYNRLGRIGNVPV